MINSGKKQTILNILIPVMVVVLALIAVVAFEKRPEPQAMRPQPTVLGKVELREISKTWEYVAQMEADHIVDLKARVEGFLVAKNFSDGDMVWTGQVMFQIEPDQYQALLEEAEADVLSAQAQLDRATLDFNRITDLYNKKTSPKSDYDSTKATFEVAQASLMSAKASLAKARLNLDYAAIKAPFDGQISDTPYSVGSLLGPESGVLATVVSVDPILVTFGISDRIMTSTMNEEMGKQGQLSDWQVRLRLGPDLYYGQPGAFSYVAPMVDRQTDTIKFKAKFDNPDKVLRPGQIVTAVVERKKPERKLIIPKEAVLTDKDGNYVFVPKEVPGNADVPGSKPGQVAEMRRVKVEESGLDKEYVVTEGLSDGDVFILKGLMSGGATLMPGAAIEIMAPDLASGTGANGGGAK